VVSVFWVDYTTKENLVEAGPEPETARLQEGSPEPLDDDLAAATLLWNVLGAERVILRLSLVHRGSTQSLD
jgi:hypothetical protein